jgi:heme/copper-type cytochrome/quinol oxidase subunit 3
VPDFFPTAKAGAASLTITLAGQPQLQNSWVVSNTVLLASSSGTWLFAPYIQMTRASVDVAQAWTYKGAAALKAGQSYKVGVYCFFNGWTNLQVRVKLDWGAVR